MRKFILIAILAAALSGCATSTFKGVCLVEPIGKTDAGQTAFATYCEATP